MGPPLSGTLDNEVTILSELFISTQYLSNKSRRSILPGGLTRGKMVFCLRFYMVVSTALMNCTRTETTDFLLTGSGL